MSLFQGQFVQPMIDEYIHYYCVCIHSQTDIGKPSAPKFICINTEYLRPRVSKELFLSEVKSCLYGILLLPITSDKDRYSGFLRCHGYRIYIQEGKKSFG